MKANSTDTTGWVAQLLEHIGLETPDDIEGNQHHNLINRFATAHHQRAMEILGNAVNTVKKDPKRSRLRLRIKDDSCLIPLCEGHGATVLSKLYGHYAGMSFAIGDGFFEVIKQEALAA